MSRAPRVILPTAEEDLVIQTGIRTDTDTYELSKAEFSELKPLRARGGPAGSGKKTQVTMRFDADVVEAFRSKGAGWQTKMNQALREWLAQH